jgi:hypothetical protein
MQLAAKLLDEAVDIADAVAQGATHHLRPSIAHSSGSLAQHLALGARLSGRLL